MELIKVILGVRHKDQTGPGLPRGLVMEIRAVALVLVLLAIFLGGWFPSHDRLCVLRASAVRIFLPLRR